MKDHKREDYILKRYSGTESACIKCCFSDEYGGNCDMRNLNCFESSEYDDSLYFEKKEKLSEYSSYTSRKHSKMKIREDLIKIATERRGQC